MRSLEEVIIRTLADYSLKGERLKGATGVWLGPSSNPRKIAAMGVRSSRWVTMHGFAFNVNTDLSFYNLRRRFVFKKEITLDVRSTF